MARRPSPWVRRGGPAGSLGLGRTPVLLWVSEPGCPAPRHAPDCLPSLPSLLERRGAVPCQTGGEPEHPQQLPAAQPGRRLRLPHQEVALCSCLRGLGGQDGSEPCSGGLRAFLQSWLPAFLAVPTSDPCTGSGLRLARGPGVRVGTGTGAPGDSKGQGLVWERRVGREEQGSLSARLQCSCTLASHPSIPTMLSVHCEQLNKTGFPTVHAVVLLEGTMNLTGETQPLVEQLMMVKRMQVERGCLLLPLRVGCGTRAWLQLSAGPGPRVRAQLRGAA